MSGGSLGYFYSELEEHVGDFGDRELDELVSDLAGLFHAREWYLSSDTGEGDWNEARDRFKAKWFSEGARAERIEKYLAEMFDAMRMSFNVGSKYCEGCAHWTQLAKHGGKYGDCEYRSSVLMHRCDTCDKWEARA